MIEGLADVLESLVTLLAEIYRPPSSESVRYAEMHFKKRLELDYRSRIAVDDIAMASSDLGCVYMAVCQYEPSIVHYAKISGH